MENQIKLQELREKIGKKFIEFEQIIEMELSLKKLKNNLDIKK